MELWIARDKDGTLLLFFDEPILNGLSWVSLDCHPINGSLFPEVTFDNSPQKVELKLI